MSSAESSSIATTPSTTAEEEQVVVQGPPAKIHIKLHILQVIKQKQNENGLKHLDYGYYRRYCTKRLRKLRSLLNAKHKKEYKFAQAPKKKKGVASTTATTVESTTTISETTSTDSIQGIKNSTLFNQQNFTDKIVNHYREKKQVETKQFREQAKRMLIRENVEKQIQEEKEKLLASFVKKKKKESTKPTSKKDAKNIQYDAEFLSELYARLNTNPEITEEAIEERIKKLSNQSGNTTEQQNDAFEHVQGDERFLHLILVQAERAWSHSKHLKNETKQDPDNSRIKFHQLNRLKKAVKWSKLLLDYCNIYSDDQRTILEAEAYNAYLLGTLYLEKESWAESLKLFKQSQTVYDQLYKVLTSIPQQIRDEYKKQVAEINNYCRLCEYNLKKVEGGDILLQQLESSSQIDLLQLKLSQVKDAENKNLPQQTIEWEGVMTITIPNEKIRINLYNGRALEEAEYKTSESKLRAFDKLFGIYNDTMRMIREEMKLVTVPNTQKKNTPQSNLSNLPQAEQLNQLRFLHSYVSYVLGTKTIERNVLMLQSLLDKLDTIQQQVQKVEKKQKASPMDTIRLFDGLLQNVNDLTEMLQSININQESSAKLQKDLNEKKTCFTAYRCYYMACSYATLQKWTECHLLLEKSENLLKEVKNTFGLPDPKGILDEIRKAKIISKAQQVLSKKSGTSSILSAYDSDDENNASKTNTELLKTITEKPITERLDKFIKPNKVVLDNLNSYNLVQLPPKYKLIPGKPVFFDIASGLVSEYQTEYIDEQIEELSKTEKPKEQPATTEEPKKKGWFGLW
ncbi:predicted protein [Naegleria gruberi]|uniref:Signal recognition particle subunit SRP68 n=1 Tax=Naegleria gruberi TaxID=5762 RepID=D2VEM0_NAEGR|nr:uncharacterized protein NAEGRDRAFT_57981 [Naegleria gruberi]EFC44816.1 predicted protein [Naegleria gruberi]|eukprot:XP_002677560.1 predicted protein [Naegleria gruberi strain NEG-M]